MPRQPAETQTLFAELSERLRALEAARTFASLTGTFAKKQVRAGDYWYFKTSEGPNGQKDYFIGPDNKETRDMMKAYAAGRPEAEESLKQIERLCAMLRQGGAMTTDTPSARVIAGLASAGVFRVGAVLVGTQAFIALGNLLGIRWESGLRTQDIDVAAARILEVAVLPIESDPPKVLDALNMGFLPLPGLDPKSAETSFTVRGRVLRVNLLTPPQGARTGKPIPIPCLRAAAQPTELLDYVVEKAIAAPLLGGGATLVNLPDPARLALYSLIIGKYRKQAGELLAALHEDRRGDLTLAVEALNKRAAAWRTRLKRKLAKLPEGLNDARKLILRDLMV